MKVLGLNPYINDVVCMNLELEIFLLCSFGYVMSLAILKKFIVPLMKLKVNMVLPRERKRTREKIKKG